jgi:general secretion pathway protein K
MTSDAHQRGFALITVLWVALILALIAASIAATMRGDARTAQIETIAARGTALADAGLVMALTELLGHGSARLAHDGRPTPVSFEGRTLLLSVQDESGKIDLNTAPRDLIRRLLTAAGLDLDSAQAETNRILDWREPGDLKRLNGAKRDDYRLAGLSYGPRGGPFASIAELQLVMGIPPGLYARLKPSITVTSQLAGVDPSVAPLLALMAARDIDAANAEQMISGRSGGMQASLGDQDPDGRAFSLEAHLIEDGRPISRSATIRVTGDPRKPFLVYAWR